MSVASTYLTDWMYFSESKSTEHSPPFSKEVAPSSSLQSTGPSTTQVVPLQVYTENLGITWERGDLETAAHIANPLKWAELGAPHEVG